MDLRFIVDEFKYELVANVAFGVKPVALRLVVAVTAIILSPFFYGRSIQISPDTAPDGVEA